MKKLSMSIPVKARLLMGQELLRQRILGVDVFNHEVLDGLITQHNKLEMQQQHIAKLGISALFLAFVAWSGSSIKIPGTGATIDQIPAFLELSLITASFALMMLPYVFLNTQIYDGLINVIAGEKAARNNLDSDILVASKLPISIFVKYSNTNPVIGRENVYQISCLGNIYNRVLVGSIAIVLMIMLAGGQIAILYIAHDGLENNIFGWFVYGFCIACALVFTLAGAAVSASFGHDINFEEFLNEQDTLPSDEISQPRDG